MLAVGVLRLKSAAVCLLPAKKQVDDSALNLSEKGFGSSFLANWRFGKNQKL